jgi:hypothetical protein
MGYTHYWTQKRNFTIARWQEIITDLKVILDHAQHIEGTVLADGSGEGGTSPEFTDDHISFNGLGDDSHEGFYIQRRRTLESWQTKDQLGWAFCKTARKPYDRVVTACLAYLSTVTRREEPKSHEPIIGTEAFSVSSDGGSEDFLAGVDLARIALPRCANVIDIPMDLMKDDRWCMPWVNCKTKIYEVHFCVDGHGYVLKSRTGESYRFESHEVLATWLHRRRYAAMPGWKPAFVSNFGSYGYDEPNIWNATGSFDRTRQDRIGKAQAAALKKLFPVPVENAHQPPAYVRPGEMLSVNKEELCYSLSDLLNKLEAA